MIRRWLALAIFAAPSFASAAEFTGVAGKIVDGDTFWICDATACHKIRVCGINAPEKGEPGYQESTAALAALVTGKTVRCVQVGDGTPCDGRSKSTNRDRIVAQCFIDGTDLATPMVEQGFACDWIKFSGGAYGGKCQSASKFDPLSASNFDPGGSEPRASALCIAP